jgi:F-type H+-transporting ATPase subunit b
MHLLTLAMAAKEPPLVDIDGTVFIQLGLFLVVMFFLSQVLFRPYLKMRADREAGIEGARDDAKRMDEQAKLQIADYENQLMKARVRSTDDRQKLRAEGVAREREIVEAARKSTQAAADEAKQKLAADAAAARAALEPRTQEIARAIVTKVLGREVA